MKNDQIIAQRFAALGHPARLGIIRALVKAGPKGVSAGTLAASQGIAANAMTFHLQKLAQVDLVSHRREGQFILYRAEFTHLLGLVDDLVGACCADSPDKCGADCPPGDGALGPAVHIYQRQKGEQHE